MSFKRALNWFKNSFAFQTPVKCAPDEQTFSWLYPVCITVQVVQAAKDIKEGLCIRNECKALIFHWKIALTSEKSLLSKEALWKEKDILYEYKKKFKERWPVANRIISVSSSIWESWYWQDRICKSLRHIFPAMHSGRTH